MLEEAQGEQELEVLNLQKEQVQEQQQEQQQEQLEEQQNQEHKQEQNIQEWQDHEQDQEEQELQVWQELEEKGEDVLTLEEHYQGVEVEGRVKPSKVRTDVETANRDIIEGRIVNKETQEQDLIYSNIKYRSYMGDFTQGGE